jgi:chemotaxis protein MotC
MIEEAALRREQGLAAQRGDADRFEALAMQYLRRFANSVHMGNFRRQFAGSLATRAMADDAPRRSRMEAAMAGLAPGLRQEIYLSVASEGVRAGKVDLVRWAARNAAALSEEGSPQHLRSRLCEAAVLLVTDEFDTGLSTLQGMPADRLDAEEEGLRAAALRLAEEVRRVPVALQTAGDPPAGASAPRVVATAQAAMARVDTLLSGAGK